MVTEISGVVSLYPVGSQVGAMEAQRGVTPMQPDVGLQSGVTGAEASQAGISSQIAGVYSHLQVRQDELNKAASFLREAGGTLDKAAQTLDKMEKGLGEIVKMYPPYPIDSPQRIALLNKLSGLRREIDVLTFPPQEKLDALGRMLKGEDGKTMAEGKAYSGNDAISGIPALDPRTASDKEVEQALDQVRAAKSAVEGLQAGMWKDVVEFVRPADAPEARNQASVTRGQLAELGFGQGIATDARQLQRVVESN